MGKRKHLPVESREPVPDFAPVPRRFRHDGWTPERQKAFIEALAETGCVVRSAQRVNIAQANCYALRRAPGAEQFRRAWDAALDFGLKRLKDIAFERAVDGQLVPVFVAGKLMGFRRVYNDKLLMFCLRHYGQDAGGKRTTINYFSTRASAGAGSSGPGGQEAPPPPSATAAMQPVPALGSPPDCRPASTPLPRKSGGGVTLAGAEASATTVRTVITGAGGAGEGGEQLDAAARVLEGFEGVRLDAAAEAAIREALEGCAERQRAIDAAFEEGGEAAIDAGEAAGSDFVRTGPDASPWRGSMEAGFGIEDVVPFGGDEGHWSDAGAQVPAEYLRALEVLGRGEGEGEEEAEAEGPSRQQVP